MDKAGNPFATSLRATNFPDSESSHAGMTGNAWDQIKKVARNFKAAPHVAGPQPYADPFARFLLIPSRFFPRVLPMPCI